MEAGIDDLSSLSDFLKLLSSFLFGILYGYGWEARNLWSYLKKSFRF